MKPSHEWLRFCLVLIVPAVAGHVGLYSHINQVGDTAHTFAWTNGPYLNTGDRVHVDYTTLTVSQVVDEVFYNGLSPKVGGKYLNHETLVDSPPRLIVSVVGEQMRTPFLSSTVHSRLLNITESSGSWLAIPYVRSNVESEGIQGVQITSRLIDAFHTAKASGASVGSIFNIGGCSEASTSPMQQLPMPLSQYLATLASSLTDAGPDVLIVCLPEGASAGDELERLHELYAALQETNVQHLGMYTADPAPPILTEEGTEARVSHSRVLLQEAAYSEEFVPDDLFYLQMDMLKGLVIALFTTITLLCGLCCMMSLDTPSKFEVRKEM